MASDLSVLQFSDYRAFLVAHAQRMKRTHPRWTFGSWALRLGLGTTSSITKIVQGERNPSPDTLEKMVRYFRFNEKEAQYFRDLVQLNRLRRDPRLALLLMERMPCPTAGVRTLDERAFSILSNWYCFTLREMVRMDGFLEDPQWLSKKLLFKATPREIGRAMESLLELKLLQRDADGKLAVAEGSVDTSSDVASEAVKRYHEQMLENAKVALRRVAVTSREFTGATLVLKTERLTEAKDAIRRFKKQFARDFEVERGDGVYQLQLQFFPLTRPASAATLEDSACTE